ncbi:hypothetical protein Plec18167_005642 [Paecilomyces lecythidis]|uniref:Uncharacterized protein n=1 Tax=Paecilomyces lecythidis TaxID=3004212 RepID=A0ABR3XGA6_9EURO
MRFFAIFAAVIASVAPAVMAQGQNPVNCLDTCHTASRDANCPADHPAVFRKAPV